MGTVNDGDGSLFGRRTRRERGKWPGEKGEGGQHGLVHVSWRGVGRKEASTRRSRRWPGRACVRRPRAHPPGKGGRRQGRGPGGLGRPLGPPGGSLSFLMFLFSTFCNCFCFIKNARAFSKILKIFVGTIEIIPKSPQLVSELVEHLNYL